MRDVAKRWFFPKLHSKLFDAIEEKFKLSKFDLLKSKTIAYIDIEETATE